MAAPGSLRGTDVYGSGGIPGVNRTEPKTGESINDNSSMQAPALSWVSLIVVLILIRLAYEARKK